jgi:hypothetical protein
LKVIGEGLGGFGDTNAWNAGIQQSSDFVNGLDEAAVNLVTSTVTGTVQQFQNLATAGSNIWNNGATTENIAALGDSVAAAGTTLINGAAMVDGAVSLAKGGTKLAGASAEGKAVTAEAKVAEAAQGAEAAQAAQAAIQAEAKSVLQRLQSNLNTLQERAAKFGNNQPVALVNQIDDHQRAISMTESVLKGEASLGEMYSEMKSMLVDVKLPPSAPISAANPRQAALTLTENQNALLEKAAKYGMDVPIELTNDIQRGKQTLEQALKAVKGEITPEEFAAALKPGPATPKEVLLGWVKDQNTLLEQAAKYGGQEPLHLINQIKDYGEAIDMARAVVEGQGTMSQLKEAVRSMIIDARVLNR